MSTEVRRTAPDFTLPGVDGNDHSLDDYADAAALVVIQSCNHCPYVLAWEDRINAIQRDYADRGVRVVAISSNDVSSHPADSFENMVTHAADAGYVFDYLYDEDQSVARALGSERTPEVFVFDQQRRLRYHGAVDDNRDDRDVTAHYLRDALDAVLAGDEPPISDTPPVGCTVKWLQDR
jgi:peroxiredoxin